MHISQTAMMKNRRHWARRYVAISNYFFNKKNNEDSETDSIYIKWRTSTHHNRVIHIVLLQHWIKYSQFFPSNLIYFAISFYDSPDMVRLQLNREQETIYEYDKHLRRANFIFQPRHFSWRGYESRQTFEYARLLLFIFFFRNS